MTASDELIAIENADVLRENGFEISVDNDDEDVRGDIHFFWRLLSMRGRLMTTKCVSSKILKLRDRRPDMSVE